MHSVDVSSESRAHVRIAAGSIGVWFASTRTPATGPLVDVLWPLTEDERRRASRFRFERDRRAFVIGRQLVRTLVGHALARPPASLVFASGRAGKPELAGDTVPSITFNLAHSGTEVVCALALGRRVGVDIERERDDLEVWPLARQFFCRNEVMMLGACPPTEVQRVFFRYWTLKEAYLKADGSGLGAGLTALDVSRVTGRTPQAPIESSPRGLLVQCIDAPDGCAAALAADGPAWTLERHAWRLEEFAPDEGRS